MGPLRRWQRVRLAGLAVLATAALACNDNDVGAPALADPDAGGAVTGFVSDDPTYLGPGPQTTSTGTGGDCSIPGPGGPAADAQPGDVPSDQALVDGDVLYRLSSYDGLTLVDVALPDSPLPVGHLELAGQPVAMHVSGGLVVALSANGWNTGPADDPYWSASSHLDLIDAADPAQPLALSRFELPGTIVASRLDGEVLRVVVLEDGHCSGCGSTPGSRVLSLSIADPTAVAVVGEVALPFSATGLFSPPSVAMAADRFYVGTVDFAQDVALDTSTVHVVDVSDAGGALVDGASVVVAGHIRHAWQMDEHAGALRVLGLPPSAGASASLATFALVSSTVLTPLGTTELVAAAGKVQVAQFEGPRLYASIGESATTLVAVDLADPASPVQGSALAMPALVDRIEVHGDRLLTLGTMLGDAQGFLHLSLVDVSALSPSLLGDVAFGGDLGAVFGPSVSQKTVRKTIRAIPDDGLVLVPFMASGYPPPGLLVWAGVQIVEWTSDTLAVRGVAAVAGIAWLSLLHAERLIATSEERLDAFDVSDLDHPTPVARLTLARVTTQTVDAGDRTVRLGGDFWTQAPLLDVVPTATPAIATPLGTAALDGMLADWAAHPCEDVHVFTHENAAHLVWLSADRATTRVATIDLSDPAHPIVAGQIDVPLDGYAYTRWTRSSASLIASQDTIVHVGTKIVLKRIEPAPYAGGAPNPWDEAPYGGTLFVVDLADPTAPTLETVALPVGVGHTGLTTSGSRVAFSHWQAVDGQPGKARFFLDRVDVASTPAVVLPPVNVPGSLIAYDGTSGRALTVDYEKQSTHVESRTACTETMGVVSYFVPDADIQGPGTCAVFDRKVALVSIDEASAEATPLETSPLDFGGWATGVRIGDDRAFLLLNDWSGGAHVLTMGGLEQGSLQLRATAGTLGAIELSAAAGKVLAGVDGLGTVATLDTTSLDAIDVVVRDVGRSHAKVTSVSLDGPRLLVSLGHSGVATFDL